MRSVIPMHTAKIGYSAVSILLLVLGMLLLCKPDLSIMLAGTIAGWLLILFGVFKLIGYFSRDLYRLAFQYDFAFGILMCLLGIVILSHPENLLHFLCIVTGLTVTADALLRLQTAREAKEFGLPAWWAILLSGILTGVFGVILLFRPSESTVVLTRLFGAAIAAEGILNLITVLIAVKIIRNQKPDIIETTYKEGV